VTGAEIHALRAQPPFNDANSAGVPSFSQSPVGKSRFQTVKLGGDLVRETFPKAAPWGLSSRFADRFVNPS